MPIYEYQCTDCGHELEVIQKLADAPLVDCPACEKSSLKKRVSAAAFRLKGGGWYETDFKSGDKKKNLVAGGEGGKDGAKTDAGKTGSKDTSASQSESSSSNSTSKGGSSNSSSASQGGNSSPSS